MGANSKIAWTDHTFNPWIGCTKVSPGCANCYAETLDRNRYSKTLDGASKAAPISHWGKSAPRHRTSGVNWKQPLRWDANYESAASEAYINEAPIPRRPRVFCASLADWLDPEVPVEWRADLLRLIRRTPNLDWLLLTKRPQLWKALLDDVCCYLPPPDPDVYPDSPRTLQDWIIDWYNSQPPANVWIGTTVEDQQRADERIPALLQIPARVRFLSCEPLLGPVDFSHEGHAGGRIRNGISWVICGAESGPKRRPMYPTWANRIKTQCQGAGVAFFMKQMEVGGKITDDMEQFPEDLQIRQFPEVQQ